MNDPKTKKGGLGERVLRVLWRLASLLLAATIIGWGLEHIGVAVDNGGQAGFGRGLIQGVLMPMALPNLLVGRDVSIYAKDNCGVKYKLGYTMGVNGAGAFFFGLFFWRLSRWRNASLSKSDDRGSTTEQSPKPELPGTG